MGILDVDPIFQSLDPSSKGYLKCDQLVKFYETINYASVPVDQVEAAIVTICGRNRSKDLVVSETQFLPVLEEIDRRLQVEQRALWDFHALKYNGGSRINLKSAMLLFQETLGEQFSLSYWKRFLSCREHPDADVYFDEVRLWLCAEPRGEPGFDADVAMEMEKLEDRSQKYVYNQYQTFKDIQEQTLLDEQDKYLDDTLSSAKRKLNRWNVLGVEGIVNDDGLDVGYDEHASKSHSEVGLQDLMEIVDKKYEFMRNRLLLAMAGLHADLDDEKMEIYNALLKQVRKLKISGSLGDQIGVLPGAHEILPGSFQILMGEFPDGNHVYEDIKMKKRQDGKSDEELKLTMKREFDSRVDAGQKCGVALCWVYERHKIERKAISGVARQAGTKSIAIAMLEKYCQLTSQLTLIGGETELTSMSLIGGLMERLPASAVNRYDLDRVRQEKLACCHLEERKGRKPLRTTAQPPDGSTRDEQTVVDQQINILTETSRKHLFEQEALIHMLQGRGGAIAREDVQGLTVTECQKRLQVLKSRHQIWRDNSGRNKEKSHHALLQEAGGLYCVGRRREMEQAQRNVMEESVNGSVLADLLQKHAEELSYIIIDMQNRPPQELQYLLLRELQAVTGEYYHNIAAVLLGAVELTEMEKEYVRCLDDKYSALRDLVFLCSLQEQFGIKWKRLSDEEKKKEMKKKRKEEKHLRLEARLTEMLTLVGSNIQTIKSLRSLIGEGKFEFSNRFVAYKQQLLMTAEKVSMEDEVKLAKSEDSNILSDIVHRYDIEQNALLLWLRSKDAQEIDDAARRLRLVEIRMEADSIAMEADFEVSLLRIGLIERVMAAPQGRHFSDKQRQYQLAKKRASIWKKLQKDIFHTMNESTQTLLPETQEDLSGRQMAYMREVLRRYQSEVNAMLQLLLEDGLEELVDAADTMTTDVKQKRLAELRNQWQGLDFENSGDREGSLGILEEAAAIRCACKKNVLQADAKVVSMEEVAIAIVTELQDHQDKELASILENLIHKDIDEIKELTDIESRRLQFDIVDNVQNILMRYEGAAEDEEILKALEDKYDAMRDKLLAELLMNQIGESEWNRLSEKERQHKLMELKLKEKQLRRDGNYDELSRLLGDGLKNELNLQQLMGDNRAVYDKKLQERLRQQKERIKDGEENEETAIDEEPEVKGNALDHLERRYEEERDILVARMRGIDAHFLSEKERQEELLRLRREKRKAEQEDTFNTAAMLIGLSQRQQEEIGQRLKNDRERQEQVAKERLMKLKNKKNERNKEQLNVMTEGELPTLQNAVLTLLDGKQEQERSAFYQMMLGTKHKALGEMCALITEQQRDDKILEMKTKYEEVTSRTLKGSMHLDLLEQGTKVKMESRVKHLKDVSDSEEGNERVHVALMAELQEIQDAETNRIISQLPDKTESELVSMQRLLHDDQLTQVNNVATLVLSPECSLRADEDSLILAIEGKYDALRDQLIMGALMNQVGEAQWRKLSDQEKQRRMLELKLKESRLRQQGKYDEAANLLGDSVNNQETLKKLMGENRIRYEQKRKEKLERRKQRLQEGMSEAECDELEKQEDEAEDAKPVNILEALDNRYDQEKDELLRLLSDSNSKLSRERQRQLELARLRLEQRRLRQEDRFESAALLMGLAGDQAKLLGDQQEKERLRQMQLAKERLAAHRQKKHKGETIHADISVSEQETNIAVLAEALSREIEARHQKERDTFIQFLEDICDGHLKELSKNISKTDRENKLAELTELSRLRQSEDSVDSKQYLGMLKEALSLVLQSKLSQGEEQGESISESDLQVALLADLQKCQDEESRQRLKEIEDKNATSVRRMIYIEKEKLKSNRHDNIAAILLGSEKGENVEAGEDKLVNALKEKYDTLRYKLFSEVLRRQMNERWERLSDEERRDQVLRMMAKERQLRDEGKSEEADAFIQDNEKDSIFVSSDEELRDRNERREELLEERKKEGLSIDAETIESLLDEEGRQKRKNVLSELQRNYDAEREALLASLQNQTDRVALERERQLAIVRLKHERRRLQQEETFGTAALIFQLAKDDSEKREESLILERDRQRELAKQRLASRRRQKQAASEGNAQELLNKMTAQESVAMEISQQEDSGDISNLQSAILDEVAQHHEDEQNVFLELLSVAESDSATKAETQPKTTQELKLQLGKLDLQRNRLKKKFHQTPPEVGSSNYLGRIAEMRQEQFKILTAALIYRMEGNVIGPLCSRADSEITGSIVLTQMSEFKCGWRGLFSHDNMDMSCLEPEGFEKRTLKKQQPNITQDSMQEELSVTMMADLQDKQDAEGAAVRNLLREQDAKLLEMMKQTQRTSRLEGSHNNLIDTIFSLSEAEDKRETETDAKMQEMDSEFEKEKKDLLDNAKKSGENVDTEELLRILLEDHDARRKVLLATMEKQGKQTKLKLEARRRQEAQKDYEEMMLLELLSRAQTQLETVENLGQEERGRQQNLLQQKLEARRINRQRTADMREAMAGHDQITSPDRLSSGGRSPNRIDSGTLRASGLRNTDVTETQKQAMYSKLLRESTNLQSKIAAQHERHGEMLHRRLEARKGKLQNEASALLTIGERQKTTLEKSHKEERDRQTSRVRERVARARQERSNLSDEPSDH